MQLSVETADLKDAIAWAKDALAQTQKEIAKIKLEGRRGELKVKAAGREQSASYAVPARVEKEGTAVVWADLASRGIQSLSSDYSSLETEGNEVKIRSRGFNLALTQIEDDMEFPNLPPVQGAILPSNFTLAVQRSAFAASRQGDDPEGFKSVRMEFRGSEIVFTATNRYRLARCVVDWQAAEKECAGTALVNASALKSIANSFKGGSEEHPIQIAFSPEDPSIIAFESAGRLRTVQLADPALLPATERLFKDDYEVNIILGKEEFLSTFRRVASIVDPKEDSVHVDVSPAKAVISAKNDKAQAKETIDAVLIGHAEEMDFNPSYILEGLSLITLSHIRMRMDTELKIVEFDGQSGRDGEPDPLYRYLLTPNQ